MIYGIGMDFCEIKRIEKLANKEKFIRKYFSKQEEKYLYEKGKGINQTIAGMLAAKEAFVKMLGIGFINTELSKIEVLHGENGQPFLCINGWAKVEIEKRNISNVFLTITHDAQIAGACVIAEIL